MPAVSKHPKHNDTSFKKGQLAWNKKRTKNISCLVCNKDFYIFPYQQGKRVCCSKKCSDYNRRINYFSDSKTSKCRELAVQGKTNREILQIPPGTVGSFLNKIKFRRFVDGGQSYSSKLNKFKKYPEYQKCSICGFSRVIDICHIVPASKGGELSHKNIISLCANHHRLFDTKKLNNEELEILNLVLEKKKCQ